MWFDLVFFVHFFSFFRGFLSKKKVGVCCSRQQTRGVQKWLVSSKFVFRPKIKNFFVFTLLLINQIYEMRLFAETNLLYSPAVEFKKETYFLTFFYSKNCSVEVFFLFFQTKNQPRAFLLKSTPFFKPLESSLIFLQKGVASMKKFCNESWFFLVVVVFMKNSLVFVYETKQPCLCENTTTRKMRRFTFPSSLFAIAVLFLFFCCFFFCPFPFDFARFQKAAFFERNRLLWCFSKPAFTLLEPAVFCG